MLEGTKSNRHAQFLLAAIATVVFLFTAESLAAAQGQQRKFKLGEMVEVGGGQSVEIIRCEGEGWEEDCEVQFYGDGVPSGPRMRFSGRNIRAGEERVKAEKEREAAKERSKARQQTPDADDNADENKALTSTRRKEQPIHHRHSRNNPRNRRNPARSPVWDGKWKVGDRLEVNQRAFWYPARIIAVKGDKYKVHYEDYGSEVDQWVDKSRMRPTGGHRVTAECNYEPPSPAVTSRRPFSEDLAKRKIYDEYNWKANGTLSAPLKIGVTFLSFRMGAPNKNTVANIPGHGAQRRHGGAPVGATIYTFKSKHMVCEQYRDGVQRRLVEGSYACFVDKDGSWTCPSENDTKITQLDQD